MRLCSGAFRWGLQLTFLCQVFSNALQAISIVAVMQCGVGLHNAVIIPKYGVGPIIKFLKVCANSRVEEARRSC